MIQRIQTIYLILVAICLGLTFLFPFATYEVNELSYEFNAFGFLIEGENLIKFPFYVSLSLSIGLSVFTISKFRNRLLQMKIGRFNYLLILLTIVLSFVNVRTLGGVIQSETVKITYGIGLFLPVASLVFFFLANRAIKKDEELIKSVERLR